MFKPSSDFIANYIDDFLVFSDTVKDHIEHLWQFYQLVRQHGIGLSSRKDKFQVTKTEIELLGVQLKNRNIHMQPHVLKKMAQFPYQPADKLQCQKFLGCINYVRDYIPKISQKTKAIRKVMVGTPFKWTAEATTAVQELEQEAKSLPPLEHIFFWPLCSLHRCL